MSRVSIVGSVLVSLFVVGLGVEVAHAGPNLVTNGNFDYSTGTTIAPDTQLNDAAAPGPFNLAGWTIGTPSGGGNASDFVFSGSAVSGGDAAATFNGTTIHIGGVVGVSGSGGVTGNFIAVDANYQTGLISQTLTGLVTGSKYAVSFYYGVAQQSVADSNYNVGSVAADWVVNFGTAPSQSTTPITVASQTFSNWQQTTMTFTADGTSDTLSFMAQGTGAPPFALLDGVSVTQVAVPEPATWAVIMTSLIGFGALRRRNRSRE